MGWDYLSRRYSEAVVAMSLSFVLQLMSGTAYVDMLADGTFRQQIGMRRRLQ